ncbi:type II secretion system F family protein [Pectinatus sottacetonis]|uniref:type II secretion system F family protein n=1 Tax=Pectinatus sottacetonis TaxID=1002795 RepID=UPI0018C7DA3A|nr:type II secretion system F family protein [Pectinatus sottacetonis]
MDNLWIALLGGIVLFIILYILIIAVTLPKTKVQQRLRFFDIQAGSNPARNQEARKNTNMKDIPFGERVLKPLYKKLENTFLKLTPLAIRQLLAEKILYAGRQHKWNVNTVTVCWLFSMAAGFVLAFIFVSRQGQYIYIQKVIILLLGLFIGGYIPFSVLNILIGQRQQTILRQLPEVLDLLCVSVQAGLSFDASLAKIVERMKGAFVEECAKMLRDVRMGMTRRMALQNMSARCNLQEVYLFVTAIIQSERLGTSMGKTLTAQADNMRERRMQSVKAQALKAPIKIIFPLVLFIFPALFVIVLLPPLLSFTQNMLP